MSVYTQLTQGHRYQMESLYKVGYNQAMITNVLAVYTSSVSRELHGNRGFWGSLPKQDHETALQRRHENSKDHIPLTTWVKVDALIMQDWSLE
jgi:IS30 family transposase